MKKLLILMAAVNGSQWQSSVYLCAGGWEYRL